MSKPRSQVIDLRVTSYYHVTHSCARRSFLCGVDPATGENKDHRRDQLEKRLRYLASVFAIDIVEHGIEHNHYHFNAHINSKQASQWTDWEVVNQWLGAYKASAHPKVRKWHQDPENVTKTDQIQATIDYWRSELTSLSRFMAKLNQPIAAMANAEDDMTGCSFWERRCDIQPLFDTADIAATMTYDALNSVRAGIAATPEQSKHTGFRERIQQALTSTADLMAGMPEFTESDRLARYNIELKPLMPLLDGDNVDEDWGLALSWEAYQELVYWSGRARHPEKRGYIAEQAEVPEVLNELGINREQWLCALDDFEANHHALLRSLMRPLSAPA